MPRRASSSTTGWQISTRTRSISAASAPSTGENAPMPPVFGPVSPSPMRLKSRAGASGTARSPSQSASTESSTPSRNSSTTTGASPNRWPSSMSTSVARASSSDAAITTPLPAASPSAFNATG